MIKLRSLKDKESEINKNVKICYKNTDNFEIWYKDNFKMN